MLATRCRENSRSYARIRRSLGEMRGLHLRRTNVRRCCSAEQADNIEDGSERERAAETYVFACSRARRTLTANATSGMPVAPFRRINTRPLTDNNCSR